jgi:hypothetical protein
MESFMDVMVFSGKARTLTSKAGKEFTFNEHRVQVLGAERDDGEPVIGNLTMRELLEPGEYRLELGWYPDRNKFDKLTPFVKRAEKK